jgi:hypothetical protein
MSRSFHAVAAVTIAFLAATGCSSDPSPGPSPDARPSGGPDAPASATKHHGDICTAPDFDCGQNTNLVCVVDQQGDTQGVCRYACGSFSDCLNYPDAHNRFDNSCCDIGNGTSVCGMESQWPAGACH